MSFPKAKIHRYYDEISCAPPPGKYDPKFESKVKGAVIEKGKRFVENKQDERYSSVDSLASCSSTNQPLFRTPTLVNKKKLPRSSSKSDYFSTPNNHVKSSNKKLSYTSNSEDICLIDHINELTQEHTAQLIEKNEEVAQLLNQINDLNEKINSSSESHMMEMKKTCSDYEGEINRLKKELLNLQEAFENETEEHNSKLYQFSSEMSALEENISNHLMISKELEESLSKNEVFFGDVNSKIAHMSQEFDEQVEKFIKCLKYVEDINKRLMEDYKEVIALYDKEKEGNMEHSLTIANLQEKLDLCRDEITTALKRCNRYEIVQTDMSKTINVLSKRLMESEIEVEHLNDIKSDLIYKKESLEEEVIALADDNKRVRDSIDFLQQEVICDVQAIESQLLDKLEAYKMVSIEESEKQKACIQEKQNAIDMLISEIDYYKIKKSQLQDELSLCHSKIASHQEEVNHLKDTIIDIENDFQDKISAQKVLFAQLSKDYECLNISFDNVKSELEKKVAQLSFDNSLLESECLQKSKHNENLMSEVESMKLEVETAKGTIKLLEETGFENEKQIEDLAVKLDHYNECAKKSSRQIEELIKLSDEKDEQIIKLEELGNEKEAEIETLCSELKQSKDYVHTVTEHVVSLMNDLTEKDNQILTINSEMEMKNATLIQISEEYDKIKGLYEAEIQHVEELSKEIGIIQRNNQKCLDEVISELVLEKERVLELSSMLGSVKGDNNILSEKIISLENDLQKLIFEADHKNPEETITWEKEKKKLVKQLNELSLEKNKIMNDLKAEREQIQIFEYERIAQELSIEELLEHRDDLLGVITRQNHEIDILSETADKHFSEVQLLNKEKIEHLNEIHLSLDQLQKSERETDSLTEDLKNKMIEIEELKVEREQLNQKLVDYKADNFTLEEKNSYLSCICDLESKLDAMEKRKNEYKIYAAELEQSMKMLKEENLKNSEERDQLKELNNENSMRLTSLEAQICDLECRNKELIDIIGPFRDQLTQFEQERNLLLSKTKSTEKELRALELEHAKIFGHQNHKQKIKHIVHLTETIAELKKEKEKYRTENLKLRHELTMKKPSMFTRRKNKENSVTGGNIVTPLPKSKSELTVSPATALKERN